MLATSLSAAEVPSRFEEHGYTMLVADGFGEGGAGSVASRVALSTIAHLALHHGQWNLRIDPKTAAEILERAEFFYNRADAAVFAKSRTSLLMTGMTTALTAAYSAGDDLFVAHVGHSRAYLFRQGALSLLTRDHTIERHLADTHRPACVERRAQDLRHILTDALGASGGQPMVEVEQFPAVERRLRAALHERAHGHGRRRADCRSPRPAPPAGGTVRHPDGPGQPGGRRGQHHRGARAVSDRRIVSVMLAMRFEDPFMMTMKRTLGWAIVGFAATATVAAAPKFTSVWKAPVAYEVSFAGKKVAALVITGDDSLRVAGEEALARALTDRGLQGVATYRIVPREEVTAAEKVRGWFERAGVEGVVALRPVSAEKRTTYDPGMWIGPSYGTLWGYYGYGWGTVYVPGSVSRDTIVVVETTIYSVPRNALLWAAVSETRNPAQLAKYVEELTSASVKELQKVGLAKQIKK